MTARVPETFLRNARTWAPGGAAGWLAAGFAFVLALLIRMALHPVLDDEFPLLFFGIATLGIQFYFGLGPALLIAALSVPTGDYFFVEPYQTFAWPDWDDALNISYYIASTACFMVLIEKLRRARYESALLAEIAESRYRMLLDAAGDREAL
jgi:K+-sensing histidine kinase KdpD